jgi:gluconolactonase
MKRKVPFIFLFSLFCMCVFSQQVELPTDLFAKGAQPVQAGSGYAFTEGSSVATDGRVFFTDQPNDKIYVWDENAGITLFKDGCERSNGTWFDRQGNLIACADLYNRLVKFTPAGQMITLLETGYEGKHFNGPNDLWEDSKGGIYFTDPYYKRDYWEAGHEQVQGVQGVYYMKPDGTLIRVIDDLGQPNGIVGTPDGKTLYVADVVGRTTWKYAILEDGTLAEKKSFAPAGSDGMTLDNQGNVYLTWGKVLIYDRDGTKKGEIALPETPSNLCFGGKDRKTLFITARTGVYVIRMQVKGVESWRAESSHCNQ